MSWSRGLLFVPIHYVIREHGRMVWTAHHIRCVTIESAFNKQALGMWGRTRPWMWVSYFCARCCFILTDEMKCSLHLIDSSSRLQSLSMKITRQRYRLRLQHSLSPDNFLCAFHWGLNKISLSEWRQFWEASPWPGSVTFSFRGESQINTENHGQIVVCLRSLHRNGFWGNTLVFGVAGNLVDKGNWPKYAIRFTNIAPTWPVRSVCPVQLLRTRSERFNTQSHHEFFTTVWTCHDIFGLRFYFQISHSQGRTERQSNPQGPKVSSDVPKRVTSVCFVVLFSWHLGENKQKFWGNCWLDRKLCPLLSLCGWFLRTVLAVGRSVHLDQAPPEYHILVLVTHDSLALTIPWEMESETQGAFQLTAARSVYILHNQTHRQTQKRMSRRTQFVHVRLCLALWWSKIKNIIDRNWTLICRNHLLACQAQSSHDDRWREHATFHSSPKELDTLSVGLTTQVEQLHTVLQV